MNKYVVDAINDMAKSREEEIARLEREIDLLKEVISEIERAEDRHAVKSKQIDIKNSIAARGV